MTSKQLNQANTLAILAIEMLRVQRERDAILRRCGNPSDKRIYGTVRTPETRKAKG